jgi:hypothetical protein
MHAHDAFSSLHNLQMSDFPPQARTTTAEVPTQDVENISSDHSTLDAKNIFKDDYMDQSAKGVIWVFTWSEIVGYLLQTVGLIAGVVFGIWAIRTYDTAKSSLAIATSTNQISTEALTQSRLANHLNLLTFCASIQAGPPSNFVRPSTYVLSRIPLTALTRLSLAPRSIMIC